MVELIGETISIGWPIFVVLAALIVYFQATIPDPVRKKQVSFNLMIGLLVAFMAFFAIANYTTNFYGESRLLPVSLIVITFATFIASLYFTNVSALMKIGGFMFLVAAALSGYGNWLPQVEGGFPPPVVKLDFQSMSPQQLADEGEKNWGGIDKW